jgi:mannose-6-phosphate isomerase
MSGNEPFTEERPWGRFRQFSLNEPSTVKILTVDPGQMFSLQYHKSRTEFWRVLSGNPRITIGDKVIDAKPGDEFLIPVNTNHRIEATDLATDVFEIAHGEFDEKDIVRLEDKYGRG